MNIFISAPIFCTYLTICSDLEDVEAYSGRSNLQANCLSDFDALFVGLSHVVACTISHSFVFLWFWIHHSFTSHGVVYIQYPIQTISTERCLRQIRNFKKYMSYTKLFQRNNTYDRCEFEYNISQADNRSFMLPTLLDHEKIALSASNITTLFFLHYRDMKYCFG